MIRYWKDEDDRQNPFTISLFTFISTRLYAQYIHIASYNIEFFRNVIIVNRGHEEMEAMPQQDHKTLRLDSIPFYINWR